MPRPVATSPTRDRIVAAARTLFAERGYHGTSVGDIEAAVGLSPRSGALYKHFDSKRDVLVAAMSDQARAVDEFDALLPTEGDLEAELRTIARWGLAELARERDLVRIVAKEGDRFPEIAREFHDTIVRRGVGAGTAWLRGWAQRTGARIEDPEALASYMLASLVGYSLQELLFGRPPADVAEDRFLDEWVKGTSAVMRSLVQERSPSHA
jgi:AcrR family transcriptional regulator